MRRFSTLTLALAVAVVAGGCANKAHSAPGRTYDSKNGFSIAPPAGWTSKGEFMGAFMVYLGQTEHGFATNFNVTVEPYGGAPIEGVGPEIKKGLAGMLTAYKTADEGYVTIDGKKCYWLSGKFTVGTTSPQSLQTLQYVIPGGNHKVYTITFTTQEANFAKYRPLFEKAAMTVVTD